MENINKTDELLKRFNENYNGLLSMIQNSINTSINEIKSMINQIPELTHSLTTLDKSITDIDAQVTKQRDEKEILERDISELKDKIRKGKDESAELLTEVLNLNAIGSDFENQLEQVNRENVQATQEKEQLTEKVRNFRLKLEETEKNQEAELQKKRDTVVAAMQSVERIQNEEPILDFLLAEGSRDTPELEIIAALSETGQANLDEIKRKASVPAAIAVRSVRKLHDAGLIQFDETHNNVRLLKQI
ncbi:MAG: hypothetical protein ACTSUV_04250 [Candidatus Ranarchaeia archaeon]